MKQTTILLLILSCGLLIAGCSSTAQKAHSGPIRARTFSFVQTSGKPTPLFAEDGEDVHALVQNTITRSLAARHVARVPQGGDVTVAYLMIKGNNAVTESINDYFGYDRDAAKLSSIAHSKYTSNPNPNYFEAGTLLIDIVDSKTWKLLNRSYATRALQHNLTPQQRAERMNQVVEEILAGVRFQP